VIHKGSAFLSLCVGKQLPVPSPNLSDYGAGLLTIEVKNEG